MVRSREKLLQLSQEGHLSKPEQFQEDLSTLPKSHFLSRRWKPTDEPPVGNDVTATIETAMAAILKSDDVTEDDDGKGDDMKKFYE